MKYDKPDLVVLEQQIYAAMERIDTPEFQTLLQELVAEAPAYLKAHLEMEHSFPSASKLMDCRLEQWLKGKGYTANEAVPPYWTKRAVAGILMEPFWQAILRMVGVPVHRPTEAKPIGEHMWGKCDFLIADNALGEFKDKNGWVYKRLLEGKGVAFELPDEYMQQQMYLAAYNREWSLYMATPDSPGMLQTMMRGYKRYKDIEGWKLPLVYLEIIDRREVDILAGLARADMLVADQSSDDPPRREYDGQQHDKGLHPCNICPFRRLCNDINK